MKRFGPTRVMASANGKWTEISYVLDKTKTIVFVYKNITFLATQNAVQVYLLRN